jgi:hypothetical protein
VVARPILLSAWKKHFTLPGFGMMRENELWAGVQGVFVLQAQRRCCIPCSRKIRLDSKPLFFWSSSLCDPYVVFCLEKTLHLA